EQTFDEFVVNRTVNQSPGTCNTGLSGRGKDSRHDSVDGLLQIGIVENDVGGLPAQFQSDVFNAAGRKLIDMFAGAVTAGKGNFRDVRVGNQRLSNFVAITGNNVHDARRKTRLLKQLTECKRGYR